MASFRLTQKIVSSFAGSPVVCVDARAIGRSFPLHGRRPTAASFNRKIYAGGVTIDPTGEVEGNEGDEEAMQGTPPTLTRVDICGVLEQRAGYHDMCGGWSDGHDAIAERLIAALEESDVLLVIDSPGGAHAGLVEAVARVEREKAQHGRRITVYADEMIGSAAYWWAACVGDEIFAPISGVVGSIGARAAHGSEAGALSKAGIEVTYFAWPGAGKVAFAPELPLSDLGKQRGERDVAIAGEMFADAVGARRGMSREAIVELDADALSGQLALDAKLIDGVASYEDVLEYALALAETSGDTETMLDDDKTSLALTTSPLAASASASPVVRAEGDDEDEDEEGKPNGKEPDYVCKNCGMNQEPNAKYCDQCGESMEAAPLEDDDDDDDDDDKGGKDGEKKMTPPPPMKEARGSSIAKLLGLRPNASDLACKTSLVRKLQVVDYVAKITETTDEAGMLGQLRAIFEDAARSGRLRAKLAHLRSRENARERLALLKSLASANLPDYPRGNLLLDEVADNGRIVGIKPAPEYAEMKLETLRGLVKRKLSNAAPRGEQSPYTVPNPDESRANAAAVSAQVEAAKGSAVVQKIAKSGAAPLDLAAAIFQREFGAR